MLVCAVAAQASTLAHLALVKHSVCLEHGELIHDAEHAHSSVASNASSGPQTARVLLETRDADEDAATHFHAHCAVTAHRRAQAAFRAAPSINVRLAAIPRAAPALPRPERAFGRTVLHFAPKCSPPA